MNEVIIPAIILGFSGGMAPGPLMTVVIGQTLKHGLKEGIKVAVAPFLTDFPIIAATLIILAQFSNIDKFLGLISLAGAGYLIYLAYESFRIKGFVVDLEKVKPQSIRKGIITNVLNPAPYLFYFTIGGAIILKYIKTETYLSILFILFFLSSVVLTKIIIAFITERSRNFLKSGIYLWVNRVLGVLLLFYALKFLIEGVGFLTK